MGYFQDFNEGYTDPESSERNEMDARGFDPDCPDDRALWRAYSADPRLQFPCSAASPDFLAMQRLYEKFDGFDRKYPSAENQKALKTLGGVLSGMIKFFAEVSAAEVAVHRQKRGD